MQALVLTDYKKLEIQDVQRPVIASPTQVLIRIKAAAICGSDVHGYDGSSGRRRPPQSSWVMKEAVSSRK